MIEKKVSVILAGYNEEQNIDRAMEETYRALKEKCEQFELVLVDDASKDRTLEKMEWFATEHPGTKVLPDCVNLNFGTAVLRGMCAATGDLLVFNACDLPLSPEDMIKQLEAMEADTDVVVLERTAYRTTRWRGVTSNLNHIMLKLLFPGLTRGTPVLNYVQIYRREAFRQIIPFARSPIFVWPEMVFRARKKNMKIVNVPVKCNVENLRRGAFGHPHDIIWGIYEMLRFRIRLWGKSI